ncbi:MAG: copper chaperone PCu(A)C [Alphaproteobacteria bacterium]|nr:copper chaperone PCu(A)C [Alphaproteobacteria bacterium]
MSKINAMILSAVMFMAGHGYSLAAVTVSEAWARAGKPNSAGFMKLANTSSTDVRIVAAQTASAQKTELHDHLQEGDVFRMRKVDQLVIPAGGEIELMPGGKHVMFFDMAADMQEGKVMELDLVLDSGEKIHCQLPIKSMTHNPKLADSGCNCKK